MYISLNNNTSTHNNRQASENTKANDPGQGSGFLKAAKKVFSVYAPAPAADTDKTAAAHFKKIKETGKPDKKRTEEDALRDIEKLLRRVEKNKKPGRHA